ncbi:hypothetical protein [Rhodococcus sp. NPDC058481]|uniref:hypothetical protein n=1 Tax=unclassified Rhodococcus (in: high G+C Gram-positive bacteria) TaxID=192944 RepID=UPI003651051B
MNVSVLRSAAAGLTVPRQVHHAQRDVPHFESVDGRRRLVAEYGIRRCGSQGRLGDQTVLGDGIERVVFHADRKGARAQSLPGAGPALPLEFMVGGTAL